MQVNSGRLQPGRPNLAQKACMTCVGLGLDCLRGPRYHSMEPPELPVFACVPLGSFQSMLQGFAKAVMTMVIPCQSRQRVMGRMQAAQVFFLGKQCAEMLTTIQSA